MLLGTRAVELRKTNGIYKRLMEVRLIKTLQIANHHFALTHCHYHYHIANPLWNFSYQYFSYQNYKSFYKQGKFIFIGWFF